jgi:hypothetical protein
MFQHILKSRCILAILVVAVLTLVQVKVAFAGCLTADSSAPQAVAAMGDCEKCTTNSGDDTYDILSKICSNHCLQDYVSPTKVAAQPAPVTTVALADTATAPPLIAPPEPAFHPGKTRLIYRLLRLQI